MHELEVDLSLAVNYVPACLTLCKCALVLLLLELFHIWELQGGVIMVFLLLCLDRLCIKQVIFDGNIILCCLCLASATQWVQKTHTHHLHFLNHGGWQGLAYVWIIFAIYVQTAYDNINHFRMRVYFFITCIFISVATLVDYDPLETPLQHAVRGFAFCIVSLLWMYVVGIYKRTMVKPADSGIYFVIYFSICLFIPAMPAVIYYTIVVFVVAWKVFVHAATSAQPPVSVCKDPEHIPEKKDHELEELQVLLRQAKERAGNKV